MNVISFEEREMSESELARMNEGFNEYTIAHGNPLETSERFGFVALDGDKFIGCSSGLAYKNEHGYSKWFYLSDLFVESPYRKQGVGAQLLRKLEDRISRLGIKHIYTWTAEYEAPEFYKKHGYEIFVEFEEWYYTGHSRVGLRKTLS